MTGSVFTENKKTEGFVISCVARVPEDVNRQGLETTALLCEQSVHQPLVGFSLPFQIVMLLHI